MALEHVVVGDGRYSAGSRAASRRSAARRAVPLRTLALRPVSERAALPLALGALLPGLLDEPLAREFAVLPTGRSLGHSLLLVVSLAALALLPTRSARVTDPGVGFGVAALVHPPTCSTSRSCRGRVVSGASTSATRSDPSPAAAVASRRGK